MGFALAKIGGWLALPPGLLVVLLVLGGLLWAWGYRRTGGGLVAAATLLLYLLSTAPVGRALLQPLERRFGEPPPAALRRCEAVAVMGGGVRPGPRLGEVRLSGSSTLRALEALRLWRRLGLPIVLSGSAVWGQGPPSAELMAGLLAGLGVPRDRLITETRSRNTYQNGLRTRGIARRRGWNTLCAVTSAYHLPRTVAVFAELGLDAVPVPADFRAPGGGGPGWLGLVPTIGHLEASAAALHEYVGLLYYRLRYGV